VQVGLHAKADRYTYLPQIGLCIAVAWGCVYFSRSWSRRRCIRGVASALAVATLASTTWRQSAFWRDSETLWRHALACTTGSSLAHLDLGVALASQGRTSEAIAEYEEALGIDPQNAMVRSNLGAALAKQERIDEAIEQCQKALVVQPGYAEAHNNLGIALAKRGRIGEAIEHFELAIRIQPDNVGARCNLGKALEMRGRIDEALDRYGEALKINPHDAEVHERVTNVLRTRERVLAALAERRALASSRPDDVSLASETAWMLATNPNASLRDGPAAVTLAERAVRLSRGSDSATLDVLAAAYAEVGRFPEAMQMAQKALQLAKHQKKQPLAEAILTRIRLYEAGMPFREM